MFRMHHGQNGEQYPSEDFDIPADDAESSEDVEGVLDLRGEGMEHVPEMILMRNEIFSRTMDAAALTKKIEEFIDEKIVQLSPGLLQRCASYYILLGDFEKMALLVQKKVVDRFDLEEEYSLYDFLKTLQ